MKGKLFLVFALSLTMSGAGACSAPSEGTKTDEHMAAALKDVPEGTVTRFVLMVATGEDGKVDSKAMAAVVSRLRDAGAENVEPLENTSIIFVTADKAAVQEAVDTGLLTSVQLDRLSKPQGGPDRPQRP